MSARVTCGNCGGRVDLPAGYAKAKIRCPHCGYYAEVPPEARSAAPPSAAIPPAAKPSHSSPEPKPARAKPVARAVRSADPRDHRPKFEADEPHGPPLLAGTQDFDDDKPYAVPGTGTKPCPHCRGELPLAATLCVHCGRDLATGERADRGFQPIREVWAEGWPLLLRYQVFGGALALNSVIGFVKLWSIEKADASDLFWLTAFGAWNSAMQAFVLGTFDTTTVRRTERGSATLTRARRVAFVPLPPEKLPWKRSHAVGVRAGNEVGVFTWGVFAYLLLLGVLPGIIFYWMVIRPERFEVVLTDVHGGTDGVICRMIDHDKATGAARLIADATGLWHKKAV